MYRIKEGYQIWESNEECDQRGWKDECQKEVYEFAATLHPESVIDVGTGSGFKLLQHFSNLHTLGLDIEPNLSWLRGMFPGKRWEDSADLDAACWPGFDLLICADVIEHLYDPDRLMRMIARCCPRQIVISTPDRDRLHESFRNGPPRNPAHVREWSSAEFRAYVQDFFEVVEHHLPPAGDFSTQFILARMKG